MHRNFLKENKISIAKLTELHAIPPHSPRVANPSWNVVQNQEIDQISQPLKSPIHRRKRIFEAISSPSVKIFQQLNPKPLQSAVRHYQLPRQQETVPLCQILKKGQRIVKQNGLCLAKGPGYSPRKQVYRKNSSNFCQNTEQLSLETKKQYQQYLKGETQRQKRVQDLENYNKSLLKQINENQSHHQSTIQESLIINQALTNAFAFQSKTSSLNYSTSKYIAPQHYQIDSCPPNLEMTSPLQMTN